MRLSTNLFSQRERTRKNSGPAFVRVGWHAVRVQQLSRLRIHYSPGDFGAPNVDA